MPTKVTKAKPSAPVKALKPAGGKFAGKSSRLAKMKLPTERKKPVTDINRYSILLYGREKFGKTTFFSTFPDILFLSTEPGTKGLEIFEFNAERGGITCWEDMLRAVDLLESESHGFKNVVIDTIDEAYAMAMAWACKDAGVKHPHDANDFGKTWNAITQALKDVFFRIQRMGLGLYMTSHEDENEIASSTGQKFTRIGPSLSGKSGKKVLAAVDFIFYCEYARDTGGNSIRVILTDGDELVRAGQRQLRNEDGKVRLPMYIPLPEDESKDYETFAAAFRGEDVGLDPSQVMPSATTRAAAAKLIQRERIDAMKGGRAKK